VSDYDLLEVLDRGETAFLYKGRDGSLVAKPHDSCRATLSSSRLIEERRSYTNKAIDCEEFQMVRLILVALLLGLSLGCVSKGAYQEAQEELRAAKVENAALRDKLASQEMKSIENLETQLASCRQQVVATKEAGERFAKKSEEAGYYKGAADFNRSLQIIGAPSDDGGWIFTNYYYTIQVRVAGQTLYSMRVKTEEQVSPTMQGLALVGELQELMPYRH